MKPNVRHGGLALVLALLAPSVLALLLRQLCRQRADGLCPERDCRPLPLHVRSCRACGCCCAAGGAAHRRVASRPSS